MSTNRLSLSKIAAALSMSATLAVPAILPATAMAQDRQKTKNEWRNLGIAGGVAGLLGLFTGNKTLAALGIGGGLYSTYRYEQDRKSQSKEARQRAALFNQSSFNYKGHKYVRKTKTQNGKKYYYFAKQK